MKPVPTYKYLPAELADRLRTLGISVRRPVVGPMQGLHKSPHMGASVEFAEYRPYVKGDPIQHIDWAVYARTDRYVIRRFQDETNLRAYILLDTSASLDYVDRGIHSKMEFASYLAASLMFILVNQHDAVSLVTFDSGIRKTFEPTGSSEGLRPMLLHLEDIVPFGKSDIENSLHEVAGMIKSRSLVVLLSDLLQPPEEILRGIRHLHHDGHDVTVMHILDSGELHPSFEEITELRDIETGRRASIDFHEIRQLYTDKVRHHVDSIRQGCAGCQAEYHVVDTSKTVEDAVHQRVGT